MTQPFIVLGCPRSGTSLVAGMLHQSGIAMSGGSFSGKTDRNPTGYWEDPSIVRLNDEIFNEAGVNHLTPPPREIEARLGWLDTVRQLLKERERPDGWGWKDPRCVLLWHHYDGILRDEFGGARIVATHRDPLHVARSWNRYGHIFVGNDKETVGIERGLRLAAEYEARLADVYESGFPVLHVAFEDWWRKPDEQREALSEFAGRALNFSLFDETLWRS